MGFGESVSYIYILFINVFNLYIYILFNRILWGILIAKKRNATNHVYNNNNNNGYF